jgi:hypothetical protein
VRLHGGNCLDGGGAGADDGDFVVLPLLLLVVFGPAGCVYDLSALSISGVREAKGGPYFSFKLVHPLNLRPLEIIQDPRAMKQHMTSILEQSCRSICLRLLELDKPLASILLPVAPNHFRAEVHILP